MLRPDNRAQTKTCIYLVGILRAVGPHGENLLPRSRKAQAVFAYLCLAEGRRELRSRLAGLIWDRCAEQHAKDSLRKALNELERAGNWRFERDRATIRLDSTSCWIDAFEGPTRSDLLLDGLHGISVSFDQWLFGERVRLENRWQATLEQKLAQLATDNAAPQLRIEAARRLLDFMPTHESAVRSLMSAMAELGDRAQALREYERFQGVVSASLDTAPSEKTAQLHERIRSGSSIGPARASTRISERLAGAPPDVDSAPPEANAALMSLSPQPSIAVLPFRNLSLDAHHDYLAEGLAEDLVEALSRVPSLFVVSRLSTAAFKNNDQPPREIGRALGVRYILSGSVRVTGDRLRLTVELANTATGAALWVSRLDEKFSDLLDVQNRLAEAIIRAVAPHVRSAELKRVRIKRPEHQDAYDFFLRAQEHMHSPSRAVFETSEQLFDLAISREPQYATALAWRAYWHVMRVGQGWSPDPSADTVLAVRYAQRAVDCDRSDPMAFAVQGHVAAYLQKDFELAFDCFDNALQINPNGARAWLWNANAHAWIGEGAEAVAKVNRAMALSPYDPLRSAYSGGASMAYLADRQYALAIDYALRCIRENRGYTSAYKLLIMSTVLAGREADASVQQLLRLEPGFTVQRFRERFPGSAWPICDCCCDALARAGVPLLG